MASAIAACAQVPLLFRQVPCGETDLAQATAVAESLYQAAVQWQWAHLLDPGDVGELGARAVCVMRSALRGADPRQQQVESMVQELKQIHEDWQLAPVRDLLLFFLGGEVDAWQKAVQVPIPVDLAVHGGFGIPRQGTGRILLRSTVYGFPTW
jgi:hypothetical protein